MRDYTHSAMWQGIWKTSSKWNYHWRCEVISDVATDADTFHADIKLQLAFLLIQLLHHTHIQTYLDTHIYTRGVRTADVDIHGSGSADFLAEADGPRICQTNISRRRPSVDQKPRVLFAGPTSNGSANVPVLSNLRTDPYLDTAFENWPIFGHCSRLCKKACLTVWGPKHCLLETV